MTRMALAFSILMAVAVALVLANGQEAAHAQAQRTATLSASKDNTLFESSGGSRSNGAGEYLYAGRTGGRAGGKQQRAVIAFDAAGSVPRGATITSVELTLRMSRTNTGSQTFKPHKLLADWGEGESNAGEPNADDNSAASAPGDATWIHTFFDTATWAKPGGDFSDSLSANTSVDRAGSYSWSSEEMVADVQAWVEDPATNFGWILIGNESARQVAMRFDSREHSNVANRPALKVQYATAALPTATVAPPASTATAVPPTATPVSVVPVLISAPTPLPTPTPLPLPADFGPVPPLTGDVAPSLAALGTMASVGALLVIGGASILGSRRRPRRR